MSGLTIDKVKFRVGDSGHFAVHEMYVRKIAEELEAARRENAALREAALPFSKLPVEQFLQHQKHPESPIIALNGVAITARQVEQLRAVLSAPDTSGYVKADVLLSVKTDIEEIIRAGEKMPEDALEVTAAKRAISRIDAEMKGVE